MTKESDSWDTARRNRAAIMQIPCPQCDAGPHVRCRGPKGAPMNIPHQARRRAAANAGVYVPGGAP